MTEDSKAIRFEETGHSRTYLILDEESSNLLGYFAVTFKELLLIGKDISKSEVKKMDGISKERERISAFLIGQIGKNASIENNPLDLQKILAEVYDVIAAARALIGGRLVFLECENNEKLINHYKKHGFTLIPDETSKYRTMYINIIESKLS